MQHVGHYLVGAESGFTGSEVVGEFARKVAFADNFEFGSFTIVSRSICHV